MKILQSASKIVFILMAIGSIALTINGTLEPGDFMILAGMAFGYYFTQALPGGKAPETKAPEKEEAIGVSELEELISEIPDEE